MDLVHNGCIFQQEAVCIALHVCRPQASLSEMAGLLPYLPCQVIMGDCPLHTALQIRKVQLNLKVVLVSIEPFVIPLTVESSTAHSQCMSEILRDVCLQLPCARFGGHFSVWENSKRQSVREDQGVDFWVNAGQKVEADCTYRKIKEPELINKGRRLTKVLPSNDIKYLCLKLSNWWTHAPCPAQKLQIAVVQGRQSSTWLRV